MCDALANEHDCLSDAEDFMAGGDLGEGFGRKPGGLYEDFEAEGTATKTFRLRKASDSQGHYHLVKKGEDVSTTRNHVQKRSVPEDRGAMKPGTEGYTRCRQNSIDASSEISNEDLRQRLQDLTEEVELLTVELEASQRQLDGKDEALKILQSMAVFNKATSHTKVMLQKAVDQRKALEKEINVLQWEIEFDQVRLKNLEESWREKYERAQCENAALKESLELRTHEVKTLKSENAMVNQQCQELLAMLDVKQQKMFQDSLLLHENCVSEVTALELAVLGTCTCRTGGGPCSCAKMSAAARKQLLQLRQEFEVEKKSKEEAYVMADAFRIAFEQQLKRRNDQTLPLNNIEKLCKKGSKQMNSWKRLKEDGQLSLRDKNKTLGQKLKGMLLSSADSTNLDALDDPQEILRVLIDMLNDKEEALAHQRKVSYMLARTIEDKLEPSRADERSHSGTESPVSGTHSGTESPVSGNRHNLSETRQIVSCPSLTNTRIEEHISPQEGSLRAIETSFSLLLKDVYPQKEIAEGTTSHPGTHPEDVEEPQT